MKTNKIASTPVLPDFPVLMEVISTEPRFKHTKGAVVLFYARHSGMIVHSTSSIEPVGTHQTNFIDVSDAETWKKFDGKLELAN